MQDEDEIIRQVRDALKEVAAAKTRAEESFSLSPQQRSILIEETVTLYEFIVGVPSSPESGALIRKMIEQCDNDEILNLQAAFESVKNEFILKRVKSLGLDGTGTEIVPTSDRTFTFCP